MPATHTSILEELRAHLGAWYPELAGDIAIQLVDLHPRARSQLMRVRIVGGGQERVIIVKHPPDEPVAFDDRPRLGTPNEPRRRLIEEFTGLELVAERFADLGDPALGTVRPLGILPETHALAMEAYDGRPLNEALIPGLVRRSPDLRATTLVHRAGRWLRAFHDLPRQDGLVRQGSRAEIVDAFEAVGRYLASHAAAIDIEDTVRIGIRAIGRLPEPPPLAICHGDFAPRNILVDEAGRVAVIDISVRWAAPVYEDLANLLVGLRMSRANALTRGLVFGPAIRRLEPAFLQGYYAGAPVPRAAIRVYELLLVLDKWAARLGRASGRPARHQVRERMIDRHFAASSHLLARRLVHGG